MFSANAENMDDQTSINACNRALQNGDYLKAISLSNQVIQKDKNNQEAYLCKGRALGQNGQFNESIESLTLAEKLSKTPREHMIALTLMGNVYRNQKHFEDAIKSYNQSIEFAKSDNDKRFESIEFIAKFDNIVSAINAQENL